jgi:MOSC domain-containing protein YiiM
MQRPVFFTSEAETMSDFIEESTTQITQTGQAVGRVESVQVGLPRDVWWEGRLVRTGIFKDSVDGPVLASADGLAGDRQADLSVHGGPTKAIYAYFAEHYDFWRQELNEADLTLSRLDESAVHVGDRFRIGTADLVVTEPRVPCFKLNVRFGRKDVVKRFLASGRSGVYFGVEKEGMIETGDEVHLISAHPAQVAIQTIHQLYVGKGSRSDHERAVSLEALPESWRSYFEQRGFRTQKGTGA